MLLFVLFYVLFYVFGRRPNSNQSDSVISHTGVYTGRTKYRVDRIYRVD